MQMMLRRTAIASAGAAPLLLAFLTIGCGGDGLPRESVYGSVMMDGQPLESGLISFVPKDPSLPTQGGATIVDGSYEIPRASGLVPGLYRVVISSADDEAQEQKVDPFDEMPGMAPIPAKEVIPSRYGSNSILEADVRSGETNRFEFTLTSGAKGS